jgi:hypothetical protein
MGSSRWQDRVLLMGLLTKWMIDGFAANGSAGERLARLVGLLMGRMPVGWLCRLAMGPELPIDRRCC